MDFSNSQQLAEEGIRFKAFLNEQLVPNLAEWNKRGEIPKSFHLAVAKGDWYGFQFKNGRLEKLSALRGALIAEEMAKISSGVAVAVLAHVDLGLTGLWRFAPQSLLDQYGQSAVRGETLLCLGNTEREAGSDVANLSMQAKKVDGGWLLNGAKAYVTNGLNSHMAIVTAVTDPQADRSNRISMFLVDLAAKGVDRKKLNKQVWIPSDLTRIRLEDVFVPGDHLLGEEGMGLQQVLKIFTYSRVPISALTLGTTVGAFELALEHARKRKIFGRRIIDLQAKSFEIADLFAKMEAARLMLQKACWAMDRGDDFRKDSSLAKYLAVMTAREVTTWAADLFGASSVIFDHPIHKFPMDAWASSLGEGTQDVQKLVIFREVMKQYGIE
ncbi:acyl-CoA dehydrogenase family protein [Thermodesulfobacteriota bacterium]